MLVPVTQADEPIGSASRPHAQPEAGKKAIPNAIFAGAYGEFAAREITIEYEPRSALFQLGLKLSIVIFRGFK